MDRIVDRVKALADVPPDPKVFEEWLKGEDALSFLGENVREREFVAYAGFRGVFMHALALPANLLDPVDQDDLMKWNCNATSGWGIAVTFSEPPSIEIAPPLEHTGSKVLDAGEQLVFSRFFDGRVDEKSYVEVLQKFVQAFDLHYLSERNAYCRIDENGDIEDVVRIVKIPGDADKWDGTVVTFLRDILDEYMVLTNSAIVRTFDFTRYRPSQFGGWSGGGTGKMTRQGELFYRSQVEPGNGSYVRGCQIVRPRMSKTAIIKRHMFSGEDKNKKYASFIAYDWKNRVVREISCAPGETSNYFTKSDLPFEVTPAFFRADVLLKYKADSAKYKLKDRSISCRRAWDLQTYDINDAGQVHTYLVYLRHLPYQEQLYWKSYNEPPKGPISRRAITTDIEGNWYSEYDPLSSLKYALGELKKRRVPWWSVRSEDVIDKVRYPVTPSADEWGNEVLHLDQLLVEGFEARWLRRKAKHLGQQPEPSFGSLKLLEECLIGMDFEAERAKDSLAPLYEAHKLRSKLKGHAAGEEAARIKKETLTKHRDYGRHFRALCQGCDESIREIAEAFGEALPRTED